MLAFIREGRIVADSLVTQSPEAGFYPAKNSELFKPIAPVAAPAPQAPVTPLGQVSEPNYAQSAEPSVFLIMAEINSDQAMKFLHLIQKLGTAQRLGDTVWLLKASMPIDDIREHLSKSLTRLDRLFVLDSRRNKTAWHNLGADLDERIRDLWVG